MSSCINEFELTFKQRQILMEFDPLGSPKVEDNTDNYNIRDTNINSQGYTYLEVV